MLVGLNPYGLCCTFGLIGQGTPRGAPKPQVLEDFMVLAEKIGAKSLEIDIRLLTGSDPTAIGARLSEKGIVPILAIGMPGDHPEETIGTAAELGSHIIRMDLTRVLSGDRAATPNWSEIVATSRRHVSRWAPAAADKGIGLAIENHQDLGSEELMEITVSAGANVGICFDTGNPLAVGEDILPFARRVAPRVRHLHLKDYRAQFTDEGYRLVRCAIGHGCVPLREIFEILGPRRLTASLEPGALEARHVRLFTQEWWNGYAPRAASELGGAIATARRNRLPDDADFQTPWERNEDPAVIMAHEREVFERSVQNVKALGWL